MRWFLSTVRADCGDEEGCGEDTHGTLCVCPCVYTEAMVGVLWLIRGRLGYRL